MAQFPRMISIIALNSGLLFHGTSFASTESLGVQPETEEIARTSDREGRARQGHKADYHDHRGRYEHQHHSRHRYHDHYDEAHVRRDGRLYDEWGNWGWGWGWTPAPINSSYYWEAMEEEAVDTSSSDGAEPES